MINENDLISLNYKIIDSFPCGIGFMNLKHNHIMLYIKFDNISDSGVPIMVVDKFMNKIRFNGFVSELSDLELILKKHTKTKR
jgi:hypothetical protein